MESRLRYVYGLDLQSDHVPAVAMQHGDLGGLAIRKRPEQVQVSRLGKAPRYLGFAEEPYVAAPFGRALDGRLQALGWNSEPLRDPVGRHQPRQPPAVGPRSHPELHGVDRLPLVGGEIGKTLEIASRDDQHGRSKPSIDELARDDHHLVIGEALRQDHQVDLAVHQGRSAFRLHLEVAPSVSRCTRASTPRSESGKKTWSSPRDCSVNAAQSRNSNTCPDALVSFRVHGPITAPSLSPRSSNEELRSRLVQEPIDHEECVLWLRRRVEVGILTAFLEYSHAIGVALDV